MPNYSLNNVVPESDRSLVDRGFEGLGVTNPATSPEPGPNPKHLPHPLTNEVRSSSDTMKSELGPGVQDILRRGNG
jgi:hypothetical protein